jgi:hypothetical protein
MPIWKLPENALFTQLCLTPKPGILSLYDELPLCPSVYLDTSFNISKPDGRGKGGSLSITPFKNLSD